MYDDDDDDAHWILASLSHWMIRKAQVRGDVCVGLVWFFFMYP